MCVLFLYHYDYIKKILLDMLNVFIILKNDNIN